MVTLLGPHRHSRAMCGLGHLDEGRLNQMGAGDFEVMDEIDGSAPSGFLVLEIVEEEE